MPRYDAPRPAGSFRSSLRSDPRYDEREPLEAEGAAADPSGYEGLTLRAVALGLAIGTVTTLENIYFALKYGWTVTNNISAAILGYAALSLWSPSG